SRGTTASGASRAAQTGAGEEDGDSDLIGAARQPDFRKTDCGITGPIPIPPQSGRPRKRDHSARADRCCNRPTNSKQSRTK
ncbi:unnamed protein product, partial [Ascophyllum nodosum]